MKRFANTGKDIAATPPVVKQNQTEAPLTGRPIQHEHIAIADRIQDRSYRASPIPLLFDMPPQVSG